jgi:hypothetical protein
MALHYMMFQNLIGFLQGEYLSLGMPRGERAPHF